MPPRLASTRKSPTLKDKSLANPSLNIPAFFVFFRGQNLYATWLIISRSEMATSDAVGAVELFHAGAQGRIRSHQVGDLGPSQTLGAECLENHLSVLPVLIVLQG